MSEARNSNPKTQERLSQALEPYLTEWTASLTGSEIDLVNSLPSAEAPTMFVVWLADKVTLYSAQWKMEWMRRQVAEAAAREAVKSLEKTEAKLELAEANLRALRRAWEECERRREIEPKRTREQSFLKRVVGNIGWEYAAGDRGSGGGRDVGL